MAKPAASFSAYTPEELLGSLNEVERLNAPEQLYVEGDLELLRRRPRVSIVGARRASEEGLRRATRLARELAMRGAVVVSGLAEGIDTAAHEGAIVAGGKTVAVLGTPLDDVYPKRNRELQALIMREHLAVSQFPLGSPVRRGNFPRRNRVMALLSDATVIVEAGETSGSLSQGWEAIRLGRQLLILKSTVERPDLLWPRMMVGYGAEVLSDTERLLEQLPQEELAEVAAVPAF